MCICENPLHKNLQEFDMLHLCAFTLTHCAKFNVHLYPCEYLHFSWYKSFHIFDMLFCIIFVCAFVHTIVQNFMFAKPVHPLIPYVQNFMFIMLVYSCLPISQKHLILSICLNFYEAAHW